jgi:hypothetical protein
VKLHTSQNLRDAALRSCLSVCVAVTALILLQGCSTGIRQYGDEISLVYKSTTFGQWNVDGATVGVLSATVSFGKEGYIHPVSSSLSNVLAEDGRKIKVIPVEATLSGINRKGLARQHAVMMKEYQLTGILDRTVLQKIGKAVSARYIILPSMAMFDQEKNGRMSVPFIGMRLFQTRVSYLRLSAQMWDTTTGEMVCGASGEGTLAIEDVREKRLPFEEIAAKLWKRILQRMDI